MPRITIKERRVTHVATFDITHTQFLDEQGQLIAKLPAYLDKPETLVHLYKTMVLIRVFDKKAIALQRTGKMGTYAPINGQEAISTAIGHALRKEDVFVPYYRDYGAQIQRGVKMSEIFAYWGGDERGSDFEHNQEDLPICVPIASQFLHAAGIAFAFKYRKQPRVVLTCIGDGGTSEGDFYEAINVAGAWNLPVVFVINNNQWAISVPRSAQTHTQTLAQKAIAAGFDGIQVDGNDILACRDVFEKAIEKARTENKPTLIEAITYRLCDHTTADDATRYQPEGDVTLAKTNEPIGRMRRFLEAQSLWDAEKEKEWLGHCANEVQKAQDEYLSQTPQPISAMFDYHFETLPDYLKEQRAIAMEEENNA